MFSVDEAAAEAIRRAFNESGELSAAIELRRRFPGITDNVAARRCVTIIASWKPLPPTPPEANSDMSDQIIDALMACAIHADAARTHPLMGWIGMQDQPDYPDEMIARR